MSNANLKQIADHYGLEHQSKKCVEELAELTVAICKDSESDILEEIVDVEIMLEQIKYLREICDRDLEAAKKYKIRRQILRIDKE